MSDSEQKPKKGEKSIDVARRRLLAKVVYVPPAVIGALALSLEGCQVASCAPSTPCNPDAPCNPGGTCNPAGGTCNPDRCGPDICNPGDF